jgi:transaldolase
MKIFLDTGNLNEIRQAADLGVLDGVTTNPSLIAKEKRSLKDVIQEVTSLVPGPVSAEVVSTRAEEMVPEGRELAKIAPNVVVKLPLIKEGIKAAKIFSKEGIRTNVTLCFQPLQALMAAKAGASYISPFIGRLDDRGQEGMQLIREIKTIYSNYGYKTEIIVASVRHPIHVRDAALIGADICTIPFAVFDKLFLHPLTDIGLQQFLDDHKKAQK